MRDGFISVAAGTPKIRVADCRYNAEQIFTLMREADKQGVKVLCLPSCASPATPAATCFCRTPCSKAPKRDCRRSWRPPGIWTS